MRLRPSVDDLRLTTTAEGCRAYLPSPITAPAVHARGRALQFGIFHAPAHYVQQIEVLASDPPSGAPPPFPPPHAVDRSRYLLGQLGSRPMKPVPTVTDSCRWQAAHSYTRGRAPSRHAWRPPHPVQANPPGQRSPALRRTSDPEHFANLARLEGCKPKSELYWSSYKFDEGITQLGAVVDAVGEQVAQPGKQLVDRLDDPHRPSRSWISAGCPSAPTSRPPVSVTMWRFRPLIFLAAS